MGNTLSIKQAEFNFIKTHCKIKLLWVRIFEQQFNDAVEAEGWVGETALDLPTSEEFRKMMHEQEMLDIHNRRELAKYFQAQNEKDAKALQQRK